MTTQVEKIWDNLFSVLNHRPYRAVFVFAAKAGDVIKSTTNGWVIDGVVMTDEGMSTETIKEDGIYIIYGTTAASDTAKLIEVFTHKTLTRQAVRKLGEVNYCSLKGTV